MDHKKSEVSIAIPIYNEENCIRETVNELVRVFEEKKVNYQIVLVNHGSWDKTKEIIIQMGKENKKLKIINLENNLGYGGGIMHGLDNSDGMYIGWTCADGEVSAEDTYIIYEKIKGGNFDVVKAKRENRQDGDFRKLTSLVFNVVAKLRFNLHLKDINGYPLFMKREIYPLVKAEETAHLFNLDLIKKIKEKNYSIFEVPVIHRKRKAGKSFMKISRIFEMAFSLFRYCLGL